MDIHTPLEDMDIHTDQHPRKRNTRKEITVTHMIHTATATATVTVLKSTNTMIK